MVAERTRTDRGGGRVEGAPKGAPRLPAEALTTDCVGVKVAEAKRTHTHPPRVYCGAI